MGAEAWGKRVRGKGVVHRIWCGGEVGVRGGRKGWAGEEGSEGHGRGGWGGTGGGVG